MKRTINIQVQPGDYLNLHTSDGVQVGYWTYGDTARRVRWAMLFYFWAVLLLIAALAVVMGFSLTGTLSEFLTTKQARTAGLSLSLVSFATFYIGWMLYWRDLASSLYGGSFCWQYEVSDYPAPASDEPPPDRDEKMVFGGRP